MHNRPSLESIIAATCDPLRVHVYASTDRDVRTPADGARSVVWWINRSQRARDTLAGDLAVRLANDLELPLVAILRLDPDEPDTNERHAAHMLTALDELAAGLASRNIRFGVVRPDVPLAGFSELIQTSLRAAAVITDEAALQHERALRARVAGQLQVPLLAVDCDVVVPTRVFDKREYAARTMRPRMHRALPRFALEQASNDAARTAMPAAHAPSPDVDLVDWAPDIDAASLLAKLRACGLSTAARPIAAPSGERAAQRQLDSFITTHLTGYAVQRNQPQLAATSGLSPFLRLGQISPHVILQRVRAADAPAADIAAFEEEFTVRRELGWNFARYAEDEGRSLACAPDWARTTLAMHAHDPRAVLHDEQAMLDCATHDPLWNAAQHQMISTGHMHGYLRMYWAKQILTWTPTPEDAYGLALRMHDRFSLDARDPNSITGVAWAIGGVHDRAWPERAIFGKVRSMTLTSTSRKFDATAYMSRWSPPTQ